MPKKTRQLLSVDDTCWKICALAFFFFLLAAVLIGLFSRQRSPEISWEAVEHAALVRTREVCLFLEERLLLRKVDALRALADVSVWEGSDTRRLGRLLENWLDEREEMIAVALWLEGREWPVQVVRKGFLDAPALREASVEGRQALFSFLFRERVTLEENRPWFVDGVFPQEVLGYPVLSVGVPLGDGQRGVLKAKVGLTGMDEAVEGLVGKEEGLVISDRDGRVVFSRGETARVAKEPVDSMRVERRRDRVFVQHPFVTLPWTLTLEQRVVLPVGGGGGLWVGLPFVVVVGLVLSLGAGFLFSRWMSHPLRCLVATATEIGRGDFSLRIPDQRSREMRRLAKLFNYMAEEMHRLQRLDLSGIISEKKKTETIIRNIADGVVVTDPEDRILVINSVAERWFGLREIEVLQKPVQACIKNEPLMSLLQEVKDGRLQASAEFSFRIAGSREERVFQAHAARVHNRDDQLIGVVTVLRDVTQEREADRIKTELVSMVAHELKSPLTSIYGFSELLMEADVEDPQAKEYAQVIMAESSRLTDFVNKFLDLSRLEAGRTEIRMHPFDLRQVIERMLETHRAQTEKKAIRVVTDIPEDLPLALGDQDMVEQVLLNLFSNAVKYSPERSKVGIEAKEQEEEILVSVIDNGYGIPKEVLPRIFDKFYRVVAAEGEGEVEGSGLGLALAREIVERHGGTIKVQSRLGVGSVFAFTLPKAGKT